jgi:hypothetical protein
MATTTLQLLHFFMTTMDYSVSPSVSLKGTEEKGHEIDTAIEEVHRLKSGKRAMKDAVDDDEHREDNDGDSDDDDSHDENAHLKQLRPGQNNVGSIRRNDSLTSFLTRSERNSILGKDPPPTAQEASKRRIQFRDTLVDVIEFDKVEKDAKKQYWMTDEDFDRIETDVKMTQFRFENSKSGKIPFDEANNSIRGLESILYGIDLKLYKHRQSVLQEIHQQKSEHGFVKDWELVRQTSESHSDSSRTKAVEIGKQDEMEHKKAWDIIPNIATTKTTVKETRIEASKNEMKKKNPLMFWKKN